MQGLQDFINTNTINFTNSGWFERDKVHGNGKETFFLIKV